MRSAGETGRHNGPIDPLSSETCGVERHTGYRCTDPCSKRSSARVRVAAASGRDLPTFKLEIGRRFAAVLGGGIFDCADKRPTHADLDLLVRWRCEDQSPQGR